MLEYCNFFEKRCQYSLFPVNFVAFLREFNFAEHLRKTIRKFVHSKFIYTHFSKCKLMFGRTLRKLFWIFFSLSLFLSFLLHSTVNLWNSTEISPILRLLVLFPWLPSAGKINFQFENNINISLEERNKNIFQIWNCFHFKLI